MGCEFFTDENGELVLRFSDHETGQILDFTTIKTKKPNHPISMEIIKGKER